MALKIPAYSFRGLSLSDVYLRVEQIAGGKRVGAWHATAKVYASAASANPPKLTRARLDDEGKPVELDGEPVMDPVLAREPEFLDELPISATWISGGVPEQLLYAELKKREAFAGAVDV